MKSIGIDSIRLDVNWNWVQHAGRRTYHWSSLDSEIHAVLAARMTVEVIIDGCPPWAALAGSEHDPTPRPRSAKMFAAWARQVVQRYAPQGVRDFEIWNEPNDQKYWQPKVNAAFYTKMLIDSYKAIKRVDPHAFVLTGGLAPVASRAGNESPIDFLRALYKHGAKGFFDALSVHPYTFPALPGTYQSWSGWSQMNATRPSLRSIMRSHGNKNIPIWVTEFGAPSAGPRGVGLSGQAAEDSQAVTLAKKSGWIGAIYIVSWKDLGTKRWANADWYGLLTFAGKAKPSYWAVKLAIQK